MNSSLTDNQSHYKLSKTSIERLKHKGRCCTISYVEILYDSGQLSINYSLKNMHIGRMIGIIQNRQRLKEIFRFAICPIL